ncbi:MAG: imidazole glycerol phosphate synthase subunit HisH [Chlorobi bacterium]|nr:imidazole glycerol phosphate synthase subunit HisH [Chlorobiota bacterium]
MAIVAVVDYGAGNSRSVLYALQRLSVDAVFTADPDTIRRADKVIFPGVGNAGSAMKKLKNTGLDTVIPGLQQPVLGVCLGLQLMCRHTTEEDTRGMGIFDSGVTHFASQAERMSGLKIPHMGWNVVDGNKGHLLSGIPENSYFYFVHGYFAEVSRWTTGTTDYGLIFSSVMEKDNFFATQFHPEKSGDSGEAVLKNFLAL